MGEGAELRRPLAITVMAGLSSSTLLTLWIIPMAYYLLGGRDKS
jgi:HAE1 family hydrophobic/amphiphilic exporter-1